MSNLAVITARGGSKRIPRKNIRNFCGKPIIAYSIEAALTSNLFDEVMVSTDDEEIAEISRKYGAKVPFFRSPETSNDYAATMDVLKEVTGVYEGMGYMFDYLCCIYPTAPFVNEQKLKKGFETLKESGLDMLIPVVKFEYPPQWGLTINGDGFLKHCSPEYVNVRSQDLEPLYHDAGQFQWYDIKQCMHSGKEHLSISTIILPETEVQDIDNESDWELAEIKFRLIQKGTVSIKLR